MNYISLLEGEGASVNPVQGIGTIVMLVAMVAIFYFFLYRPQKKQDKAQNEMRNSLSIGAEIDVSKRQDGGRPRRICGHTTGLRYLFSAPRSR